MPYIIHVTDNFELLYRCANLIPTAPCKLITDRSDVTGTKDNVISIQLNELSAKNLVRQTKVVKNFYSGNVLKVHDKILVSQRGDVMES